jgi:hypothetical protein
MIPIVILTSNSDFSRKMTLYNLHQNLNRCYSSYDIRDTAIRNVERPKYPTKGTPPRIFEKRVI